MSGAVPSIDILYLTHNYPRFEGDFAGSFIARLAQGISASSRHVGVLAPHHAGAPIEEIMSGVPVWRFRYANDRDETIAYRGELGRVGITGNHGVGAHWRFMRAFSRAASSLVTQESPQILHAHWWIPAGWIAHRLSFGGRLLVTLHGTDLRLLRTKRWLRPLAARVFSRADVVTVVSNWLGSALTEIYPDLETKLRIAPMPPNDAVFRRQEHHPLRNDIPVILSVTRFTVQKRNNVLLNALAILRDSGIAYRARLIGEGPLRDDARRLIGTLKIGERVVISDPLPQSDLAEEYGAADVVVLSAVDEGFGMTLVEAQLCGTAVVGVRSGGLRDIITDGETGLLAEPDDASNLADVLRRILTDAALRDRLAVAGHRSAEAEFSSATILRQFSEWYEGRPSAKRGRDTS